MIELKAPFMVDFEVTNKCSYKFFLRGKLREDKTIA